MDSKTRKSLEKALDYLRSGRTDRARPILVDVLKRDPGLEEAWYLLSFAVGDPDKQIYMLEQALRLNPENEKAAARLEKARRRAEMTAEETEEEEVAAPLPEEEESFEELIEEPEPAPPEERAVGRGGTDLLSQRLLGIPDADQSEKEPEAEKPIEAAKPKRATPPFVQPAREMPADYYVPPVKKLGSEVKPKKRRRWVQPLVLLLLIAVIGGGAWVYIGPERIINNVSGFIEAIRGGGSAQVVGTPTATPTREPTPEGFRELPPTWTPTPSLVPSNTPLPTETPLPTDTPLPPDTPTPGTPES